MHFIKKILIIGGFVGIGCCGYKLYQERTVTNVLLHKLQEELLQVSQREKNSVRTADCAVEGKRWCDVQSKVKDTVVQIFSQIAEFNWLEPYKTPNQYQSSGSGFFFTDQGDIITNAHVVDQARAVSIQVPSTGKRRFEVDVIGVSPERDLAWIRLRPEERDALINILGKIPTLPLGDSDQVHRADEIMALGYPLGQQSLKSTTGVVSGREHLGGQHLIQISAPINPGSSGGPSIDMQGAVVGINSSGIFGGGVQNVGYVIPVNEVALFLRQLEQLPNLSTVKFLRKPFLGVLFNSGTESLVSFLGNPHPGGLYVVETHKNGPLNKIGVVAGDMIYELDGHRVDTFGEMSVPWSDDKVLLTDYISRLMFGDDVQMVVYREGKRKEFLFKLCQCEPMPVRRIYPGYEKIDYEVIGGMVVMQLSMNHVQQLLQNVPELVQYMEFKNQIDPTLIVTHVLPDSEAARSRSIGAGILLGEVNGIPVQTLAEFREAVRKSLSTGFLTIKTKDNVFTVLPFDKILNNEARLAENYYYPLSELAKSLLQNKK